MNLLGLAAHQMGNHAEALNLMQTAEAIEPFNLKIRSNIGSVFLANWRAGGSHKFSGRRKIDPIDGELALDLALRSVIGEIGFTGV